MLIRISANHEACNDELNDKTNMDNMTSSPFYGDITRAEYLLDPENMTLPTVGPVGPQETKGGFSPLSLAFKVVYLIGIVGNLGAIVILRTGERRVRNRKHLLLLTTLAANDLIALVRRQQNNQNEIRY